MKSKNTFGIHFVIRLPKNRKNSLATIYARITVNGQRAEISLRSKISVNNWNEASGKAKGKGEEIAKLNSHMERVRSLINDSYYQLVQKNRFITVEAVKSTYLGHTEEERMTLLKLSTYHKEVASIKLASGTIKNYATTERYLQMFMKQSLNASDVQIDEISYKFITDFEYFLHSYKPKDHHKPLNNNGIMKHIERLRKLINLSIAMGWLDKDPFSKYKLKFEKVERGHLSDIELKILNSKSFSIERLQNVLDMFLFSCYTGLAYIDIFNLGPSNVVTGIDGKEWLVLNRQKTNIAVRVPLLPEAIRLINKYTNHPVAVFKETIFPVVSNQRMNGYLKEIAEICGIRKNLTFHLARHTFATTVTLSNGVPIESVSKMLGHTSIRTTQIYAKVLEQKLSEDMNNLQVRMALKK